MRGRLALLAFLTALCISACVPATAGPGIFQRFANACEKSNEGQRIALDGYLRLPDTVDNSRSVELGLYPDLTFSGKPVGVMMLFGNGPNQAQKIPAAYHDDDLKVRLADGRVVPFGTRVRVSGRMYYPIVHRDFACILENPYVQHSN